MPYSRLANPSATIAVLQRHNLAVRKSLGQHFLVDDNIVGRIVRQAAIRPSERVLEVGPGIGTLTDALLAEGAQVVAVERDVHLLPVLSELAQERGGLEVVHADAVEVPMEALCKGGKVPTALVANLPYAVAAKVVLRFFEEMPALERAVVMVQAEVADRITAAPGSKLYGAYTVKLGLRARPVGRFPVPRTCFLPPPRVDSAVVALERREQDVEEVLLVYAARAADAAFCQRRKTLRNAMAAGLRTSAQEAVALLASAGIDPSLRAEDLGRDEFLSLGKVLLERQRLVS